MTHEEKKQIIDAAIAIREYCKSFKTCNELCLFYRKGDRCRLCPNPPENWALPKLTRWTPEDIMLAKALKAFGAKGIYRNGLNELLWKDELGTYNLLEISAFSNIDKGEFISIDTIIKEAEG